MKAQKTSLLSIALLLVAMVSAQAAELASAKVVDVTGTVTKHAPDGQQSALQKGDILKEGDSISVTALGEAELVFSNGSELTVEENTSVGIAKLQQESFSGNKSYGQLQADPSKSQTLLELNYGKLTGHVKELREDSQFHVETPLGTAAIRGTRWAALLIYNAASEEFVFTVNNFDGEVDMISGEDVRSISESTREAIPAGQRAVRRVQKGDPAFDDLFSLIENTDPTGPKPVITPAPTSGPSGDVDDDFGIIVVSPEGGE